MGESPGIAPDEASIVAESITSDKRLGSVSTSARGVGKINDCSFFFVKSSGIGSNKPSVLGEGTSPDVLSALLSVILAILLRSF